MLVASTTSYLIFIICFVLTNEIFYASLKRGFNQPSRKTYPAMQNKRRQPLPLVTATSEPDVLAEGLRMLCDNAELAH